MTPSRTLRAPLVAAVFLPLCLACARAGDARAPGGEEGAGVGCPPVRQIPFESVGNQILLRVRVNESREPVRMILDSAAHDSYLFTEQADRLGLKRAGEAARPGVGEGPVRVAFAEGVTLDVSGVRLAGVTLAVTPKSILADVDGILGYDLFSRYVVEIDYEGLSVRLYEPRCEIEAGGASVVPLSFAESDPRIPTVRAAIRMPGGAFAEGTFDVDTGAGQGVLVRPAFAGRHKMLEAGQRLLAVSAGGLGGGATVKLGRADAFRLGGFTLLRPVVGFFQKGASDRPGKDGLIGNGVLGRFRVTFDYPRKRLLLAPNARFGEPFEFDASGLSLAPDREGFRVAGVFADTPGSQAGLREGDVIVALDGKPAASYSITEVRRMLRREGKTYVLDVRRGAETLRVPLTTRRII